jgi:hypothetical protein
MFTVIYPVRYLLCLFSYHTLISPTQPIACKDRVSQDTFRQDTATTYFFYIYLVGGSSITAKGLLRNRPAPMPVQMRQSVYQSPV